MKKSRGTMHAKKFHKKTIQITVALGKGSFSEGGNTKIIEGLACDVFVQKSGFTHNTIAPVNAIRGEVPTAKKEYWPAEKEGKWVEIEDHRGLEGYLNGEAHIIKDFGPLPDDWSAEAPVPSLEQQLATLQSTYAPKLRAVLDEINVAIALDDKTALTAKRSEYPVPVPRPKRLDCYA